MNDLDYDLGRPHTLRRPLLHALEHQPDAAFSQISLPLAGADLLAWLQGQDNQLIQFFWTSRKRAFCVAAIGEVARWQDLAGVEAAIAGLDPQLYCYGGWRFRQSQTHSVPWQDWPDQLFFLPRWELRSERGESRICLNLAGPRDSWPSQVEQALASLQPPQLLPVSAPAPDLGALSHEPGPEAWQGQIQQAKDQFASAKLQKLVLSRVSAARLDTLPLSLMERLLSQGREAYHYWFQPLPGQILWGASPERLYARSGQTLWTEALAGTRPRPTDPIQQEALRQELLGSHKEFEENERVRQHLEAVLGPLSTALRADPLRVIPSGPVQHLYRCMQAELLPEVSNDTLVGALHPTPAVSGYPSHRAIDALDTIEQHDRGWYAGALGWISSDSAEWSVALRCALWKQPEIHFFTGAGIMPASEPEAEWQELEVKLASLLALWE